MKKGLKKVSHSLDNNRTRYCWCQKSYSSTGAYSNHIEANYSERIQSLYRLSTNPEEPTLGELYPDPPLANGTESYLQYIDSNHEILEEINDNDNLDASEPIVDNKAPSADNTNCDDKVFPRARASFGVHDPAFTHPNWNPFYPFNTEVEYKLARFFHPSKMLKSMVTEFFQHNVALESNIGFKSGDMLRNLLDTMVETPQ